MRLVQTGDGDSPLQSQLCDTKIHSSHKLASRHARVWVCEVCQQAPARLTRQPYCVTCDGDIHSVNPLAQRHERVPMTPFDDSVNSSAIKHNHNGGGVVVNFLHEERYFNDDVGGGSGGVSSEEAEAASWLLPNPKLADLNTGQTQEPDEFSDMDPYLYLDSGHVDPKSEAQEDPYRTVFTVTPTHQSQSGT